MKIPFLTSRPAQTLLYITEAKTFRIDVDKHGVTVGDLEVLEYRCETEKNLPNTLELIFAKARPIAKNVWILYARLGTQVLNLPTMQVAGAEEDMLDQALLFEYESLTGDNVAQCHIAHHFISDRDEMSSYWVTVIAKEVLTKVMETLKPTGCKLKGLMHPGGLPMLMAGDKNESWLRIETFSNAVFALHQNAELDFSVQIFSPDLNHSWAEELDAWIIETGDVVHSETIMNNRVEYLPDTAERFHLTTEGALEHWLVNWGRYLIANHAFELPLINSERKLNYDLIFMLGGGGFALALCAGHFTYNLMQRNEFQFEVENLTKIEKDIKAARKGNSSADDERAKLEKTLILLRKNVKVLPKAIDALQKRPMAFLEVLAKNSPNDLMIESIGITEDSGIIVKGISLQQQLINSLARDIKPHCGALGWEVNSPTKKGMEVFKNGGPWEFTIQLDDKGLAGFVK